MTVAQQARLKGILAQLPVRGFSLSFPGGQTVVALLGATPLDGTNQYQVANAERSAVSIAFVRSHLSAPSTVFKVGATLTTATGGVYRVTRVESNEIDLLVSLKCEVVNSP